MSEKRNIHKIGNIENKNNPKATKKQLNGEGNWFPLPNTLSINSCLVFPGHKPPNPQ